MLINEPAAWSSKAGNDGLRLLTFFFFLLLLSFKLADEAKSLTQLFYIEEALTASDNIQWHFRQQGALKGEKQLRQRTTS